MPKPLYHSPSAQERPSSALVNDQWSREVVPRLPQQVNEQAKRLKAFVRRREVKSATDLLRGLLAYVLCGSAASFRRLGAWAMLIGLADMSETAWRQRLRKASAWLLWLLGELLAAPVEAQTSWLHGRTSGRVLLVDATRRPRNGPAGPGVAGAHGL
jgi:hypothetical protein